MTEEGPPIHRVGRWRRTYLSISFSSSLSLLRNIDVADTMLCCCRTPLRPTDRPAGWLSSAQTVTQTRRLLQFGDTEGCRLRHRRLQKSPIEAGVREQQAERTDDGRNGDFFLLILDASARFLRSAAVVKNQLSSRSPRLARCN